MSTRRRRKAVMQTTVGQPLVQSQLDADMRRLYGTGDFEHVNYRILDEPGKRVLVVDAVEKAWGPNYLRLGIGLSSDFSGETYFNVLASHRMTWLNPLGAEFRTDVQLGFEQQPAHGVLPAARCQGTLLRRATRDDRDRTGQLLQRRRAHRDLQRRVAHRRARRWDPVHSIRRAAGRCRRRHCHPQARHRVHHPRQSGITTPGRNQERCASTGWTT